MIRHIDALLMEFRPCFSRRAAFAWFVVVMLGFLVRADQDGLTSIIRWLFLPPVCYDPLVHRQSLILG